MDWITTEEWDVLTAEKTDAFRVGWTRTGWLDRYGDWVLWSGPDQGLPPGCEQEMRERFGFEPSGWLVRSLARRAADQQAPVLVSGEAPGRVEVREGGLRFLVEPKAGYSSGLFLDQRLNRAWVRGLGARRMLNLFAYTCSFTVCAAAGGGETRSVDVSKRALACGRDNLRLNGIDAESGHAFVADDVVAHVGRLARRGVTFDLIVLDPPTFGRAGGRTFRLEHDLPPLAEKCIGLLEPGGRMLLSCNFAGWGERDLQQILRSAANGLVIEECPPALPHGAVSCRVRRA